MRAPRIFTPTSRLQLNALWELVIFLLNGALFVLVGLQLPEIIDALDGYGARRGRASTPRPSSAR